jgi:predicted TIM-barrel fold metal-dependent hydrolase
MALLGIPSRFEMRFGNPLDVQAVAAAHPSLPIVIPHFGAGMLREALMLADACPNVYFDTSSSNRWIRFHPGLTLADVFSQALEVVGADRLLFGTDSSSFPQGWKRAVLERQRDVLKDIGAGDDVATRVFGGNFDRLLPVRA